MKRFLTLTLLTASLATTMHGMDVDGNWHRDELHIKLDELFDAKPETTIVTKGKEAIHLSEPDKAQLRDSIFSGLAACSQELRDEIHGVKYFNLVIDTSLIQKNHLCKKPDNSGTKRRRQRVQRQSVVGKLLSQGIPAALGFGVCYLAVKQGWIGSADQ